MSRKLAGSRYEELKSAAADFIEDYALSFPLEPLEIAHILGVHVVVHPVHLPPTAQLFATDDGYTEPVDFAFGPKFRIHINGTMPGVRQRFTVTHELAHIWLEHLRVDCPLSMEVAEAEANFLAAYLLAPDVLAIVWLTHVDVPSISMFFNVSDEAAQLIFQRVMRALNLKAINKPHDVRILQAATLRLPSITESPLSLTGSA